MPTPVSIPLARDARIQYAPGVGPQRALAFERLGIHTVEHLLRHYPRAYLDARRFVPVRDARPGGLVTVDGTITRGAAVRTRGGRSDFIAELRDGTGVLGLYFFGQPFLARTLTPGTRVVVSGELDPGEARMQNPMFEVIEDEVARLMHAGRMVPVHALTRGLTARGLRRIVHAALERAGEAFEDPIPRSVIAAHALLPLRPALRAIHFPESDADLAAARRRLAFEELFLLQAVLSLRRWVLDHAGNGLATAGPGALAAAASAALPFTLTDDQRRSLDEIVADLRRERPMQRLLLGDVGSGKTVVALLAALHVIEAGHQAAFMAPTEILARQHGRTLERFARPVGAEVAVLTGSTPAEERAAIAARLEAGTPMLVAGTHALLEDTVRIPNLALAIVDEQHRFGVRQRALLARKSAMPDVLVLTATPIPRTLTLAEYGDLDVSRLALRPSGRGRLVTRVAAEEKFPQVIEFMARELDSGHQAFVVVPLIEEGAPGATSATSRGYRAAEAEFQRLCAHPLLKRFPGGLLHGRLKAAEKQRVMTEFAAGAIRFLVATTVVEVGIDVPNATLMVVENAERFGLTQLHQLRGRVGRGEHRSVCVLMPGPGAHDGSLERLEVMTRTDDGFEIAEADLRLRGPGELWGVRQSGLPRLKLADLARDEALLAEAHAAARTLVEADPRLEQHEHEALRRTLLQGFREPVELALAG